MTRKKYPNQTSLSWSDEDFDLLKEEAKGLGISVSGFVRMIFKQWILDRYGKDFPKEP